MSQATTAPVRDGRPFFLITIDTEGDHLWSQPREITTRNAAYIPRFQALCERHGLKPTYLTNYEMALAPDFQALGQDALRRGTAEIGMHLHAWNSPPLVPLTSDDFRYQPYLAEYPEPVLREKVAVMTGLLQETFGRAMVSHRAGRWALSPAYLHALDDHGYKVDCSVTPHVSWKGTPGNPAGRGGSDYSLFPEEPYFIDLDQPARPGLSGLLEVPMTILSSRRRALELLPEGLRSRTPVEKVVDRLWPARWLRPGRGTAEALCGVLEDALARRPSHVEFMLHSSELMPGGSPTFPGEADIERLYDAMEALFERTRSLRAGTLSDFHEAFVAAACEPARAVSA